MKDKNSLFKIMILTSLSIFMFTSCEVSVGNQKPTDLHKMELDSNSQYSDQNYRVYTLEGCEYIVSGYGNAKWGSHKGNCKNSIHQKETSNGQN